MFKINGLLTVGNVLKSVNPLMIFTYYCKHYKKPGAKFPSEFRSETNPSSVISYYNGTYIYRDFGEDSSMNCFQYVQRKFGLTFNEALQKINEDFNLYLGGTGSAGSLIKTIYPQQKQTQNKTIITIKRRDFKEHDLLWWGSQSWQKTMLMQAKISPIEYFRLTMQHKGIEDKLYICDDYSYSMDYYFYENLFLRKLYFPLKESGKKWLSNTGNTVTQGWGILPKHENIVFITSSFKDTGQVWNIYGKPCGVAPSSESKFIPDKSFYKLKQRYKDIVLWFDSDETGIKNMKKFSQMYQIPYIMHNPKLGKDQAEIWQKHGGNVFRAELIRILEEKNLNTYL